MAEGQDGLYAGMVLRPRVLGGGDQDHFDRFQQIRSFLTEQIIFNRRVNFLPSLVIFKKRW